MGFIASALGAFDTKSPKPSKTSANYAKLVEGYLNPQTLSAVYGAEEMYKPKYTNLALQNFGSTLTGTDGATGLLDLINQANTSQRAAGVSDLGALGGGAAQGYAGLNPQGADLMSGLNTTAQRGLDLGGRIDPETAYNASKATNANWYGRGLGASLPAGLDQAMSLYGAGENARQGRQQFATGVASLDQLQNQSLLGLLTGQSPALGAAGAFQASSATPTLFPPSQQYDVFNTAYNALAGSNLNNANNAAAGANSY